MKRIPSTFLFFLLLLMSVLPIGPAAWAQETPRSEVFLDQAAPLPEQEAITAGEAIALIQDRLSPRDQHALQAHLVGGVLQGGSFGLITQQGTGNTARLVQAGAANLAVLSQQGDRNTTLLEQIGTGNIYGAWLTGHDNMIDVVQHGADNVYLLDFEGHGLQHQVVQHGVGNQAVQLGTGRAPFSIEQRGDHMEIVVRHGSAVR
ncbi:MAG: hypothetical protein AAGI71_00940 [Bacteroidota bacterium]